MGVSIMYKDKTTDTSNLSKAEIISKNFTQLVNAKLYHATIL